MTDARHDVIVTTVINMFFFVIDVTERNTTHLYRRILTQPCMQKLHGNRSRSPLSVFGAGSCLLSVGCVALGALMLQAFWRQVSTYYR